MAFKFLKHIFYKEPEFKQLVLENDIMSAFDSCMRKYFSEEVLGFFQPVKIENDILQVYCSDEYMVRELNKIGLVLADAINGFCNGQIIKNIQFKRFS